MFTFENPSKWNNAVDSGVYNGGGIAEGPYLAIAKVGLGKVAFIGDSSPVEDATPKYVREDSAKQRKLTMVIKKKTMRFY